MLDDDAQILQEYQNNFNYHTGYQSQPGLGYAFFKWVIENHTNPQQCRIIHVTPHAEREFVEFPTDPDLVSFDKDDRKFVAVALASESNPEVLNASDTDWWHHKEALRRNGVYVIFLCLQLIQAH